MSSNDQQGLPATPEEKQQLLIDAELAAYPYHRSLNRINQISRQTNNNDFWVVASELTLAAAQSKDVSANINKGFIYNKNVGLTAYILKNNQRKEIRLIFGGTTSGKVAGDLNTRYMANSEFALNQWLANADNLLQTSRPESYLLARDLAAKLYFSLVSRKDYQGFQPILSGHSKGGGEATYAALAHTPPFIAICFSSAELGELLVTDIPEDNRENAACYVTHINIQGDWVPKASAVIPGLKLLGKVITIPARNVWSSPIDRHDQFIRHIFDFAKLK